MARRTPRTPHALAELGRVRLSRHFFLRNFLNSEIGNVDGVPNLPSDPDLAIAAGRGLCAHLLEPLVETFGPIEVRSGYRSPALNAYGNAMQRRGRRGYECASNAFNRAGHIWDLRDRDGRMGACATIAIPWFVDRGGDWRDLAYWMFDHLPFEAAWFFPKLTAFNLTWKEGAPGRAVSSYVAPRGTLIAAGAAPPEGAAARRARHADFPPFRGIAYP
ncbi:MAG: hypothetical protein ACU0BS_14055 [Hasllibacter sp.]